jgi:hypothetical protein
MSCHVHSIIFRLTATASLLTIEGMPVVASLTMLLAAANVVAPFVLSSFSCSVYVCRSWMETWLSESEMRMLASLMMASCWIGRRENFSSSRRSSAGFFGVGGGACSPFWLPFASVSSI